MKNNCLYKIAMFIIFAFTCILNVKAITSFPLKLEAYKEDNGITLNNDHSLKIDLTHNASSTHNYPYFHRKFSSQGDIICVSGLGYKEPYDGLVYTQTSWNNANEAKGVAYIINQILGEGGMSLLDYEKYYWTEVMINAYLGTYSPGSNSYMQHNVINAGYKIPGTELTYNQLIDNAKVYANADYSVNLSTSTNNLTFTLGTDGYYYSNPVTVTSNTNYTVNIDSSKVVSVKDGNKYTFKIKETDITPGASLSFSVTISNESKSYYTAQRYTYGTGYQDLTLGQTLKNTVDAKTIKLNGSVSRSGTTLIVTKKDSVTKKGITGAVFTLYKSSDCTGTAVKSGLTTNSSGQISISNLEIGTYSLKETTVPGGYATPTNTCTKVELEAGKNSNVEIENQPLGGATIIKKDSVTNKGISGVKFALYKGANCISDNILDDTLVTNNLGKIVLDNLEPLIYSIKEIEIPIGFVEPENRCKSFIIHAGKNSSETTYEFLNIKNKIKINKINLANGEVLAGATLQIEDEKGNIVKYCKNEDGNTIECKWVSTDETYIVEGMPVGKYYLVEIQAPEGYVLNVEKKEFIVDGKTPVIEVEMENALEEEVPDTLSSRSALLLAIAMFDIALGIGIITYVKKNKIQQ